ncbi:hypothetical protein ACFYT5_38875 [Streptomyces anulatus]|uniref:hypothetical protein n=1 Tax=Streptomyces anulatus TaxID=1892 RepID=UPI00368FF806
MGRVVMRCCGLLLGLLVIWTGVQLVGDPYRQTVEFRRAEACPSGSPEGSDCIGRETGRVVRKRTYTTTTTTHDGATGTTSTHTSTHRELSLRRALGQIETHDTSIGLYNAARRGSRADLDIWHGEVVGIAVRGHRDQLSPSSAGSLLWTLLVAWAGAGLVLWSALGDGRLRGLFGWGGMRAFAWLFLGIWTLWPTSEIVAHGASAWGWAGRAAFWVPGAAVSVWMLWGEGPEWWSKWKAYHWQRWGHDRWRRNQEKLRR